MHRRVGCLGLAMAGAIGLASGAQAVIYGVAPGVSSGSQLFSVVENGTGFAVVGSVTCSSPSCLSGPDVDVLALAASPTHGLLGLGDAPDFSELIRIDPGDASATPLGFVTINVVGAAFAPDDTLWALDPVGVGAGSTLVQLDPTDGDVLGSTPLLLGGLSHALGSDSDLAVRSDGSFYVTDGDAFFALDPITGVLTSLDMDVTASNAGAAFSGLAGPLFTLDALAPALYVYDVDAGFTRTTLVPSPALLPGGDLAAMVPEPAAGASLTALLALLGRAALGRGARRRA